MHLLPAFVTYHSPFHKAFVIVSRKLCEAPFNKTVEWAKWHIFWADERVVAKSHVDSNYKLLKDNLLTKVSFLILGYFIQIICLFCHLVISEICCWFIVIFCD